MKRFGLAASVLVIGLAAGAALAQPKKAVAPQQQVLPPEARYWMGATTGAGMMAMMGAGEPSMTDMMRMATGGGQDAGRSLNLKLGSSLAPTGAPEAFHTMPAGAQVNKPIFLETPKPSAPGKPTPRGPEDFEPPKGSIKFYWGCGDKARPGQPVVLTYEKLMTGRGAEELAALESSVDARGVRTPSVSNSKTYSDWPNQDRRNNGLRASFPVGATLEGQHTIKGSYSPDIAFTLGRSFMDPVRYTTTATKPNGAIGLAWGGVNRATGYALGVMSGQRGPNDTAEMVMWSSAERPATFIIHEDITPDEAKRLIGLKAILPPTQTSCAIPVEVVKAVGEGGMLFFTAFGDQETFIHPARPADPKVAWDQDWFTRVNFKSIRMDMVSPQGVQDMSAMMAGAGRGGPGMASRDPAQMSDADYCAMLAEQKKNQPSLAGSIGEATGIPGAGMLGRAIGGRKKKDEPIDPRCAPK